MMLEKLYFENCQDLLLTLNPAYQIENASDLWLEAVESNQTQMFGQALFSFIDEEEREKAEKFLSFGRTGEKQLFTWKTEAGHAKPFRFKIGFRSAYGMIIKMEDPGALKNKWGKKIVNEQILQLLLNLIPFPLFVKNGNAEYVLLNQAQADLFGLTMAEMIGKSDEVYIEDEEELALVRKSDQEVFDSFKKTVLPAQHFTTPNGKVHILETIKVPFINDVTGETNILGVSIDITERKLAEAQLEKNHLERDKLIHKVTQELYPSLQPILDLLQSDKTIDESWEIKNCIANVESLKGEIAHYAKAEALFL